MAEAVMKEKKIKLPTRPALLADFYWKAREERLRLDKEAARAKLTESAAKEKLIQLLPMSDATGVAGKLCRVQVVPKKRAEIVDWGRLASWIRKNDAFEMLQHRLNMEAVKERWEAKKEVPGVEARPYKDLSVSKVK